MKAWMDATNTSIVTLVNGTANVREPYGLTIDFESELLYWTDAYLHRISVYDLHSGNMSVLLQSSGDLLAPRGIGVSAVSSLKMIHVIRKTSLVFPTRSDTNRPVQSEKLRSFKVQILEED